MVYYFVSDKMRVVSKHNDDEQFVWGSAAGGTLVFQKNTELVHGGVKHGNKVICHLRKDQRESLETRCLNVSREKVFVISRTTFEARSCGWQLHGRQRAGQFV